MSNTAQMFNIPDLDGKKLCKLLLHWSSYLFIGVLATFLFCVIGLFLGGGFIEPPVPEAKIRHVVTDTIVIEPEKKLVKVELTSEIPRMDVSMDTQVEMEMPPLNINYTINANLTVGVMVPAPPLARGDSGSSFGMAIDGNTVFGVHQLETQPRIVHAPPPVYPRRAMQMKREGVVLVRIVLDKEGNMVSSRLLPGDDVEFFGPATLEAVKRWRFTPGKIGNRPVMCEVEIPVEYNLSR